MATAQKTSYHLFGLNRKIYFFILIILIIGFFFGAQYQKNNTQNEIASWKTYTIKICNVSFKYPQSWEGQFEDKGDCTIHYWKPGTGSESMNTFVIWDIQPEMFLGRKNIEIEEDKVISRVTVNGIERIIEYSEEKSMDSSLILVNKNYYFKIGSGYMRMISQYKKEDKDFEDTLDAIAQSVIFKSETIFYENYFKNLERELTSF